jgi:hypothetical protein
MEDEIRSTPANAKFHAMLRDISRQVKWGNPPGLMDEETWKRVMLAAKYGQRVVVNPLDGMTPIVVNARRSRTLTREEMAEFLLEIEAFGANAGVDWSEDE